MKGIWIHRGVEYMQLPEELTAGLRIHLKPGEDLWFIPDPDVVHLLPPVLQITTLQKPRKWWQFWRTA